MSQLSFKTACRQGVIPLISLYGESGCGKTMSALLLARGMVGPSGRIGLGDTESGRGELYSDVIPGGYEVCPLSSPFTPQSFVEFLDTLEAGGFNIGILDSGSHSWEGIGGVLEMAGDVEHRTGKPGLHCWRQPKMEHQKFVLRLLQSRIPIIVCLRAKYKSRQVKNERGKNEIVKDDHASPIQAEDFIFEMTAHAEVLQDHTIRVTKHNHPDLRACFPEDGREPLSVKHGEAIAEWARGGRSPDAPAPKAKPKTAKAKLWEITANIHGGKPEALEQYLKDTALIQPDATLSSLTPDTFAKLVLQVEALINPA